MHTLSLICVLAVCFTFTPGAAAQDPLASAVPWSPFALLHGEMQQLRRLLAERDPASSGGDPFANLVTWNTLPAGQVAAFAQAAAASVESLRRQVTDREASLRAEQDSLDRPGKAERVRQLQARVDRARGELSQAETTGSALQSQDLELALQAYSPWSHIGQAATALALTDVQDHIAAAIEACSTAYEGLRSACPPDQVTRVKPEFEALIARLAAIQAQSNGKTAQQMARDLWDDGVRRLLEEIEWTTAATPQLPPVVCNLPIPAEARGDDVAFEVAKERRTRLTQRATEAQDTQRAQASAILGVLLPPLREYWRQAPSADEVPVHVLAAALAPYLRLLRSNAGADSLADELHRALQPQTSPESVQQTRALWNHVRELATFDFGTALGRERKVAASHFDAAPLPEVLSAMQRLRAGPDARNQAAATYLGLLVTRRTQREKLAANIAASRAQLDALVRDHIAKPEDLIRQELAIAKAQDERERLGLVTRTDISTLVPHRSLGVFCMDLGIHCPPEYATSTLYAFEKLSAARADLAPYVQHAKEVRQLLQEQKTDAARSRLEDVWDQILAGAGVR